MRTASLRAAWIMACVAVLALAAAGCARERAPSGPASTRGDRESGVSAQTTPTAVFAGITDDGPIREKRPTIWLHLNLVNTTDASLPVFGRGRYPVVVAADGTTATVQGWSRRIVGGQSYGSLDGRTSYLDPGGTMQAVFGLLKSEASGKNKLPLTITWEPIGGLPTTFTYP